MLAPRAAINLTLFPYSGPTSQAAIAFRQPSAMASLTKLAPYELAKVNLGSSKIDFLPNS